jgi:hypothetical protein
LQDSILQSVHTLSNITHPIYLTSAKAKAAAKAKREQAGDSKADTGGTPAHIFLHNIYTTKSIRVKRPSVSLVLFTESTPLDADVDVEDTTVFSRAEAGAAVVTEPVADTRPSVLVLGGTGMIGRNFVTFLVQNNLASKVRVADKMIPVMGFMHPSVAEVFDTIDFVQADLTKPAHIDKAFANMTFDYVVNFAAETRYGQPQQV